MLATKKQQERKYGKLILCVTSFDAKEGHFSEELSYEEFMYGELMGWYNEEFDITDEILAWMSWPKLYSEEDEA